MKLKKLLCGILATIMLVSTSAMATVTSASAKTLVNNNSIMLASTSNTKKSIVKITLNKKTGLLVISGKGRMEGEKIKNDGLYTMDLDANLVKSIHISEGITDIDGYYLEQYFNCKKLYIPSTVSKITNNLNNDKLVSINVNKNNKYFCSLSDNLYNKNKTKLIRYASGKKNISFTIPKSVTSIGNGAFANSKLKKIVIPNSVKNIGKGAFVDCAYLTNIVIPNSINAIKGTTFFSCTSLEKIIIPSSVKNIGTSAFSKCSKLKSVIYRGTKSQWNKVKIAKKNEELKKAKKNFKQIFTYSKKNNELLAKIGYAEIQDSKNDKLKRSIISCAINNYNYLNKGESFTSYIKSVYFSDAFNKIIKSKVTKNWNVTINLIKQKPNKYLLKDIKYYRIGEYFSIGKPAYRIGNIYFSK